MSTKRFAKVFAYVTLVLAAVMFFRLEKVSAYQYLPINVQYGQTEAREMLTLINQMRQGSDAWYWNESDTEKVVCSNLAPLQYDAGLEKVAMKRAEEIVVSFSHTRPSGESCFTAYDECGVFVTYAGENIAYGYSSKESVFNAWAEEYYGYSGQGHRRNMLGSKYNAVGIGHVFYNGYHYWVQEFGYVSSVSTSAANDSAGIANVKLSDSSTISYAGSYNYGRGYGIIEGQTDAAPMFDVEILFNGSIFDEYRSAAVVVSADEEYVSFKDGMLTGLKPGRGTITCSYNSHFFDYTITVIAAPTSTPRPTAAPTSTPRPTAAPTSTPRPTAAPTLTPRPTAAPTSTPRPTAAPTSTPRPTATPTSTPRPTVAPTSTPRPTAAPTSIPVPTSAAQPTGVPGEVPAELKAGCKFVYDNAFYRVMYNNVAEVELVSLRDTKVTTFTVPSTVSYRGYTYNVTKIKENAFKGNKTIKSVKLGEYIEEIGSKAFYGCKKLKTITIQSTYIGYIGNKAFSKISKSAKFKLPKSKATSYNKMIEKSK